MTKNRHILNMFKQYGEKWVIFKHEAGTSPVRP